MSNMLLTIQHNGRIFSPPVKDGVKIEWERTGSPGKLTFTTPKVADMSFVEGDQVCFYLDDKLVFTGYVFKKKRDREHHIEVTCYDQIRYLKNKYTYVFENKTASEIISALCKDFDLSTGTFDNTNYVIPSIAEENKAALDIILNVLEDTLLNTGNMFVLYDNAGKLEVKNCANMRSTTLILEDTAENFDYTSSIDDETYNQIILYYKNDDKIQQIYTAYSPSTVKQWGTLRYFEEVKTPTIGQNKANSLLKLYNKKTRELNVSGAFGDISVRGGTLIPVKLYLGDVTVNNYMLVQKVTHNFENDIHTMDLTLEGEWTDTATDIVSSTYGELSSGTGGSGGTGGNSGKYCTITLTHTISDGNITYVGAYYQDGEFKQFNTSSDFTFRVDRGSKFALAILGKSPYYPKDAVTTGSLTGQTPKLLNSHQTKHTVTYTINEDSNIHIIWGNVNNTSGVVVDESSKKKFTAKVSGDSALAGRAIIQYILNGLHYKEVVTTEQVSFYCDYHSEVHLVIEPRDKNTSFQVLGASGSYDKLASDKWTWLMSQNGMIIIKWID